MHTEQSATVNFPLSVRFFLFRKLSLFPSSGMDVRTVTVAETLEIRLIFIYLIVQETSNLIISVM
jgi:hypothetical protein